MSKINRRDFLKAAAALAASPVMKPGRHYYDFLASLPENNQENERYYPWLQPGQSIRLKEETDYKYYFRQGLGEFRFSTEDPFLGSTVMLMDSNIRSVGSGMIIKQADKLFITSVGHVLDPSIFENSGHISVYSPFLGYYITRPNIWQFSSSYSNENGDSSHAFFELTNDPNDILGQHVNYYHSQYLQGKPGIMGFTPIWKMPAEGEAVGYLRPDRVGTNDSPLQPARFSGWGVQYTRGGFANTDKNTIGFTDYFNRATVCAGMSGSPLFEVDQVSGMATGNVFGGISSGGFSTDGYAYDKDYFETLGDDRGCESISIARPFVNGVLDPYVVVGSDKISNYLGIRDLFEHQ